MATIPTKFMIISDTHDFQFGDAERCGGRLSLPIPKVDVLLHCGDITEDGGPEYYEKALSMLGNIDAELKLVIAGNHDLDLDSEYWARRVQMISRIPAMDRYGRSVNDLRDNDKHAKAMMTGPVAKKAGVTYLKEGTHEFTLRSGACFTIYASPYTPEFCNMAFPYRRNEDRFNPAESLPTGVKSVAESPIPGFPGVDIVMTHGPPQGILDTTVRGTGAGCEALLRAARRARPRVMCFGHIHEAHGAVLKEWSDDEKLIGLDMKEESKSSGTLANPYPLSLEMPIGFGQETLMVNAAIQDVRKRPINSPWMVSLDLLKAS